MYMDKKQVTLLNALQSAGSEGLTPVQIQKVMFLYGESLEAKEKADFYNFVPYNYGPFDKTIYSDLEKLVGQNMLKKKRSSSGAWYTYYPLNTSATHSDNYIDKLVKWAQKQSFKDLLLAIYEHYPQYKEKSVFIQSKR